MGDTVKITFASNSFTEITGLITGAIYDLQNIRNIEVIIKQVPSQPGAEEEGKIILPFKAATIIKEATPVWIRAKSGTGTVFYNARA